MDLVDTQTVKALANRIAALEHLVFPPRPDPCTLCGDPMDVRLPAVVKREFVVAWAGEPDDGPDCCPGCGRRRVFRIEFDKGG